MTHSGPYWKGFGWSGFTCIGLAEGTSTLGASIGGAGDALVVVVVGGGGVGAIVFGTGAVVVTAGAGSAGFWFCRCSDNKRVSSESRTGNCTGLVR